MIKPKKQATTEIRRVDSDVLVHDVSNGKVHVLNRTAGAILELCDGTRSVDDIALAIRVATGAEIEDIRRDVDRIVHQFGTLQLVDSASEASRTP